MSELLNVKIEQMRISNVPVNGSDTIHLGDNLKWDATNHCARPVVAGDAASAAAATNFIGVSLDSQPIVSLNENLPFLRVNICIKGMVQYTVDDNATYYPGDYVTFGAGPQLIRHTSGSGPYIGVVAAENEFGNNWGSNTGLQAALPPTPVPPVGAPLATTGIAATAGVTKLLIYIKPQFTALSSW